MMGAVCANMDEKEAKKISSPNKPFLLSEIACFTARAVKAMKVKEGFWLPTLVIQAPSVTKTFLQACI